jgi:hypothetical protein
LGRDDGGSRFDLGSAETEMFLQTGLDRPNHHDFPRQIALGAQLGNLVLATYGCGVATPPGSRSLLQVSTHSEEVHGTISCGYVCGRKSPVPLSKISGTAVCGC